MKEDGQIRALANQQFETLVRLRNRTAPDTFFGVSPRMLPPKAQRLRQKAQVRAQLAKAQKEVEAQRVVVRREQAARRKVEKQVEAKDEEIKLLKQQLAQAQSGAAM